MIAAEAIAKEYHYRYCSFARNMKQLSGSAAFKDQQTSSAGLNSLQLCIIRERKSHLSIL